MSEYKKIENAKAELTVKVDKEKWAEAQEKAFNKLAKNVEVAGFRKGQAPKTMIRQQLGEGRIMLEAAESLAQGELEAAIKEHDLTLIDRPELKIEEMNSDALTLGFICPVYPDVELGDYKKIEYKEKKVKVTKADVSKEIDNIRERKAEMELKEDGKAEKGETVVIDYVGEIDGVPFEGGSADNQELELGSGAFIPGFEDQLVGCKSEEKKDVKVTFPEDYHAEDLAGKEAVFHVTVHEIKKKVLPELDEELIAELQIPEVKTQEELEKYIHDQLSESQKFENKQVAEAELLDKLVSESKIEIPEVMINEELENLVNEYERQWSYQMRNPQFKFDESLRNTLRDNFKEDAKRNVSVRLCLNEVAKKENITVSEEDLENKYQDMAKQYDMEVDDVKRMLPDYYLKEDLKNEKTLSFLKGE